jgi:hypothetical protein
VERPGAGVLAAPRPDADHDQVAQEVGEHRQDALERLALRRVVASPVTELLVVAVPGAEADGDLLPGRGDEQVAVPGRGAQAQLDGLAIGARLEVPEQLRQP